MKYKFHEINSPSLFTNIPITALYHNYDQKCMQYSKQGNHTKRYFQKNLQLQTAAPSTVTDVGGGELYIYYLNIKLFKIKKVHWNVIRYAELT